MEEGGSEPGPVQSRGCHFHQIQERTPAARFLAATGLVKSRVVFLSKKSACGKIPTCARACEILGGHFHKRKACGKLVSSNKACQFQGCHVHQKKSACGKLPSNKACQSSDHDCNMNFEHRKVTFRTNRTPPAHRQGRLAS